jgi:hypothetical protein
MPEEQKTYTDEEQLAAIGHTSVETPDGDIVDVNPAPAQEPEEQELETQEVAAQEPVEEPAEELTEEQRRTWQSEADKAKHRAEQLEQDMEQMKLQNQQLLGLLQGSQATGTGGVQAPQPAESKEPQLSDFIDPSQYVAYDAMDPNTASGQAYSRYQRAINRYDSEQVAMDRERKAAEKKKEEVAMAQAQKLADAHPEFRDPFGRPNMVAISNFIATFSESNDPDLWVNLYNLKNTNQSPSAAPQSESVAAIGRKANQVSTVSGQASGEPIIKQMSKTEKQYRSVFGDFVDLPEDAGDFE